MLKQVLYTVTALLLCCCQAKAQLFSDYNFKFKTYTTNDGLVHNSVKKCQSDAKGFLWIITENGLSRFDGFQFKNYQHINNDSTSMPSNDLTDMVIDKEQRIWIAAKLSLCYFDPATQHFVTLQRAGKQVDAVRLAYSAEDNILFVATQDGLIKYDTKSKQFSETKLTQHWLNPVTCLFLDPGKKIWLGVERQNYYRYDPKADTAFFYKESIWPVCFNSDNEGNIFLSTWGAGLRKLDVNGRADAENTFQLKAGGPDDLPYIFQGCTQSKQLTGTDILWVATHSGGLALFSKSQRKFVKWFRNEPELVDGIKTDFNWNIYAAPDGSIWISTWHGLCKVNSRSQQFQSAELPELVSNFYNCLTGLMDDPYDKRFVWMSVNGSGIIKYNKSTEKPAEWYFRDWNKYLQMWSTYLFKDSNNIIWSGSYGGFTKIKNGKVSFKFMPDENNDYTYSNVTYQDGAGNLWLAGRYPQRFNPYTEKYKNYKFSDDRKDYFIHNCTSIAEGNNNMLIGTNTGLQELDTATGFFTAVNFYSDKADSAGWKNVKALQRINDNLYIATQSGIMEMNLLTKACQVIGAKEYIYNCGISSLYKDASGKLWIYANNGVYRLEPASHEILKFSSADGIYNMSNDATNFFEYDHDLFIGYRAAYTRFDPAQVTRNSNKPVPFITAVKAGGSYLNINSDDYADQVLVLDHTKNNLSFDYTAIEYSNPEKLSFSYMLEGFDKYWIDAGTGRTISYTNLPGGNYIFKVKACNSSGICSDKIANFKIRIIPPFWKRWWFLSIVIVLVTLGLYAIMTRRIKKLQRESAVQKQMAELEMKALRSQMNPHFIFNSLNSIHKYIWENKQDDASEYLTKFSKLVRMILENSKEKAIPLSKELETLQLYIELEHRRCNHKFDYSITVDPAISSANTLIPSMIIQPYVENAIWHGLVQKEGHGNLNISITRSGEQLNCVIEDDGIGRKKAAAIKAQKQDVHRSLGLNITEERLNLISKEAGGLSSVQIIDIESGENTGTKIILQLPLNMMY